MNLLSNACKFTQDGSIKVQAWVVSPENLPKEEDFGDTDEQRKKGRFYCSVQDSGCGISEADQKKLFRDFSTLKANAHLNPNGVGLGLSICRKICNKLCGDISVKSKIGSGTKFTFYVAADLESAGGSGKINLPGSVIESKGSRSTQRAEAEMPSEFSNLGQRMTQVFQQFATDDPAREITYPIKFNSKGIAPSHENSINLDNSRIGPMSLNANSAQSRVLVVDDQVFNIEFLRC